MVLLPSDLSVSLFNLTSSRSAPHSAGLDIVLHFIRDFLIFSIDLMRSLSVWIRSEPLVLAVVAIFFVGFLFSLFYRIYSSC